jgi:hypothetical protein
MQNIEKAQQKQATSILHQSVTPQIQSKLTSAEALDILMFRAVAAQQTQAELKESPLIAPPTTALEPVMPPKITFGSKEQEGARTFVHNLNRVLTPTKFESMNPDQLLAQFLKLQIVDPNNSVETHQDLHQAMSELRQLAIDEAQARIARAEEQRKEAEAYASFASTFGALFSLFTLALSFITLGASMGAQAIIGVMGQVASGFANAKAADMSADARQQQLLAERMRLMAEMFQEQLEEEGKMIEALMESKNQAVDAIIKMLNSNFMSHQKILAAGMAR